MFDVNTDMGIVVTIMVIAILVLVVVVIMMVSSHSREQRKALSDISAQIKEVNDRPVPEPQVIQYVPVMAPQAAEGTATEGTVSAGMPDGHAEGIKEAGDAAEKTTDPLEEILNFSFMTEKKPDAPKEDKSNIGRSGRRYTKEEVEALIKN